MGPTLRPVLCLQRVLPPVVKSPWLAASRSPPCSETRGQYFQSQDIIRSVVLRQFSTGHSMVYTTSNEHLASRYGGESRISGKLEATDRLTVHTERCEVTMKIRTACNTNCVACIVTTKSWTVQGSKSCGGKRLSLPLTHAEGRGAHLVSSTTDTVRLSRG